MDRASGRSSPAKRRKKEDSTCWPWHNAEIGATSFFVVRPMAEEETSKHAQKSESADAALTEQDQQDLQAIQDMQDQDAMDNMYMDQAGIPGGDNKDGGGGGGE